MALLNIFMAWTALALGLPSATPEGGVLDGLLHLAATADDPQVRAQAVKTLTNLKWRPTRPKHWRKVAQIGTPAVPFLQACLADAEPGTRKPAVASLLHIAREDPKARPDVLASLSEVAANDKSPAVRQAAAKARDQVKALGDAAPRPEPQPPEPEPAQPEPAQPEPPPEPP
ncbi:MAG: HEAT repeat domain-containing protein, partial [Planctomycetota bacterium]